MKVSVVIPTRNAGPGFEELLKALSTQKIALDLELLVVDSGSTDGTVEVAERHGAKVHEIPAAQFNHGATRNLGISLADGDYVALIVQDAVPLDDRWLSTMVENLERDELVAVVYSRHVPRPEAGVLTRALVNNLSTAGHERREQYISDPEEYRVMRPAERRKVAAFDNVSSCIRRSVWEEFPFERASFAEDLRWGKRAVESGYKIVYEPRSAVVHSHERGPVYDLRRYYVDGLVLLELFGAAPVSSLRRLVPAIPYTALRVYGWLRREAPGGNRAYLALVALRQAVVSLVGAYLGAKSPGLERRSPGLHNMFHRFLSRGV